MRNIWRAFIRIFWKSCSGCNKGKLEFVGITSDKEGNFFYAYECDKCGDRHVEV